MKKYSKKLCFGMISLMILSTQLTISGCGPSTPIGTTGNTDTSVSEGTGIIRGVVTAEGISTKGFAIKAANPDISLATVKVSGPSDTKEVKVEKDGSFSVPVKSGSDYTVEATVPDTQGGTLKFVTPEKINVPVAKDPPIVDIKSLVTRKTGTIQGLVSIEGTDSLEGMDVFIPGTSNISKTNDKGRFALTGVAAGKWKIIIQKPGFDRGVIENIVVNAGEPTLVNQNITLKKGNIGAGLKGIINDNNGNALAGATVSAYPIDRKTLGEGGLENFTAISNEKGEYEILNLPVGKYQVQLYRPFYELPARQNIEITANTTKDLGTLKLSSTVVYFGKIAGKVVDEKGKALDAAVIQTKPQVTDQQFSDSDGNFTLDRVMPGEYNMNVSAGGYCTAVVPMRVENINNYTVTLEKPVVLYPAKGDPNEKCTSIIGYNPPDDKDPSKDPIVMPKAGKLKITVEKGSAGLSSDLYLNLNGQETLITKNAQTNADITLEKSYNQSDKIDFFIRTNATTWGLGIYDHGTNTPAYKDGKAYYRKTQINPNSWRIEFEDLPGNLTDWDYNDVVIKIEIL